MINASKVKNLVREFSLQEVPASVRDIRNLAEWKKMSKINQVKSRMRDMPGEKEQHVQRLIGRWLLLFSH